MNGSDYYREIIYGTAWFSSDDFFRLVTVSAYCEGCLIDGSIGQSLMKYYETQFWSLS